MATKKYKIKSHMWTKEDIKTLATLWETASKEEIAEKLNITSGQVGSMAQRFKKVGFALPRKRRSGAIAEKFLIDTLKAMKFQPSK